MPRSGRHWGRRATDDHSTPFSDLALSLEIAELCGANWRYVADAGRWLQWSGTRWQTDRRDAITEPVLVVCREASRRAAGAGEKAELVRGLASNSRVNAVVKLLARDQRMVATLAELDRDPMLLGTPSGLVDLTTGAFHQPGDRDKLITLSTAVDPAPKCTPCPLFEQFLASTFPVEPGKDEADHALIDFLWRWAGYTLTGLTKEEAFVFLIGTGSNGKGTLTRTWQEILGDYFTSVAPETLMERAFEVHKTELAHLVGKRLLVTSEIRPGLYWNESRLKGLVAGDTIRANFMRQDEFDFTPVGKLVVQANNAPIFRTVNIATERRLMLVRFNMNFLKADAPEWEKQKDNPRLKPINLDLKSNLAKEYPAILRRMIDGCLAWQKEGLQMPQSVQDDTSDYLSDQDDLGASIDECCRETGLGGSSGGRQAECFESWTCWREENGLKPTELGWFRDRLRDRGWRIKKGNVGKIIVGLVLTDFARAKLLKAREAHRDNQERTTGE